MSGLYKEYFDGNNIRMGKARLMRDVKKYRLNGRQLSGLIDDLEAEHLLTDKPFTPKPKECWDEEYLDWLSNGHISDYFSRAYLEHYGEVADYLAGQKRKRTMIKILGVILAAALLAGLVFAGWFFCKRS